jgi:FkbM family methyltransferase
MPPPARSEVVSCFLGGRRVEVEGSADDATVMGPLRAEGCYEPHLVAAMERLVRPEWVVLDVGANVGVHTLAAAGLATRGQVYAFEPALETFSYLEANLRRAGLRNAWAERLALSSGPGTARLSYRPHQSGASHFLGEGPDEDGSRVEEVPCCSLDSWVASRGLDRVDLMKVDVEGAEMAVLDGAAQTLAAKQPWVIIECNPVTQARIGRSSYQALLRRLQGIFRSVWWVRGDGSFGLVLSGRQLGRLLGAFGLVDLVGTFEPVDRARRASPHRPELSAAAAWARLAWRGNRWRRPERSYVGGPVDMIGAFPEAVSVERGGSFEVSATVVNRSRQWLSSGFPDHPVLASYHWLDEAGRVLVQDGRRTPLPADVPPGGRLNLTLVADAPLTAGGYVLGATLVQERYVWLDWLGGSVAKVRVTVT